MPCQRMASLAAIVAFTLFCTSGCGKVPTWDELQGKKAPAPIASPAPAAQAPIQLQPAAAPQAAPNEDPLQVLNWFKSLQPSQVNDQSLLRLTSTGTGVETIKEINAIGGGITDAGAAELSKFTSLEKLSLDGNPITDAGLKSLQQVPSLTSLSLNATRISAEGIGHLAAVPNLTHLELMGVQLTPADFEAVGKLPAIETLVLNRVLELNDAGLDQICNASTLKSLQMNECIGLTDKGLIALAKAPGLEVLSLDRANITGVGFGAAASKGGLKSLKVLSVSAIGISLSGARAINSVKSLERLNIDHIPGMNDLFLGEFVEGLKNLKSLNVEASAIFGSGFAKLKAATGSLETVNARDTTLTDAGLGLLRNHKKLKFIDVSNTTVSPVGIQQFKKAVPNCELLWGGVRY